MTLINITLLNSYHFILANLKYACAHAKLTVHMYVTHFMEAVGQGMKFTLCSHDIWPKARTFTMYNSYCINEIRPQLILQ